MLFRDFGLMMVLDKRNPSEIGLGPEYIIYIFAF